MRTEADTAAKRGGSLVRQLRTVAEAALLGAVTAGILLGWTPMATAVDVHAVGALTGAGLGVFGLAKQLI